MGNIAVIIGLILFFSFLFFSFLNVPYVYKSWETQECKYIEYADGTKDTCDKVEQLGGYELIWTK